MYMQVAIGNRWYISADEFKCFDVKLKMAPVFESCCIYSVTTEGDILQFSNNTWKILENDLNPDLRFKRLTSSLYSLWGICGDHQVYVRLLETNVPVRIKEESYENQRWNPVDGFCDRLLPTDRPNFSSADGLENRNLVNITLPNKAWIWDDEWHLELVYEGQHLCPEGWTYAIDFPRNYTATKAWNSCVRRRKWVRHRQFNSQSWSMLQPITIEDIPEPFIDIATGGQNLIGAAAGYTSVWGVTINGLLLYREGVTLTCPEGSKWTKIETPAGWEPCQVSISSSGIVWILAWNGRMLARHGITWNNEMGIGWYEVPTPFPDIAFSHISVGPYSAWAVGRDNEVWFRKGLDESNVLGTGWTAMVGQMNLVFTGSESQTCALSAQDQQLYIRTGITAEEASGRTWKRIEGNNHSFSWIAFGTKGFLLRIADVGNETSSEPWRESILDRLRQRSLNDDQFQDYAKAIESTEWVKVGRALLHNQWINLHLRCSDYPVLMVETMRLSIVDITAVRCEVERTLVIHSSMNLPIRLTFADEEEVEDWASHLTRVCWTTRNNSGDFSHSIWALTNIGDPFFHESKVDSQESGYYEVDILPAGHRRSDVFIYELPDGFYRDCSVTISGAIPEDAKRFSINFQCGSKIQLNEAHTSKRDVALHINPRFGDDSEVIRNSNLNGVWNTEEKNGSFNIHPGGKFSLTVTCERQHFRITLNDESVTFTHRLPPFNVTHLVMKGDVHLFGASYGIPKMELAPSHLLWTQVGGHFARIEAHSTGVVWAIGEDGTVWIHSGSYGGGFFKGLWGSNHGFNSMTDDCSVFIYENQRWNPVHGFASRGLPTDRSSWSDETGRIGSTKEATNLPNRHWSWISDWLIDYHPPDGADKEGWQYATDFPSRYHNYKGSFDYVRRRRWQRKCRLTTVGPWVQFGLTKLMDVSMQIDHSGKSDEEVLLWAIAANGSIIRRVGVTAGNPQGDSWEAVLSEHTFMSISIGVRGRIWAVTTQGSPTLRHRVNSDNPDGAAWLLLDRPEGNATLKQISAGDQQVWAVDTQNKLYRRRDIMPILPEGTGWDLVAENVLHVSIGKNDEVWAVLDQGYCHPKLKEKGSICVRKGCTKACPSGTGWEFVIGGGWSFICNRGFDIPHA